ncbi:MULTISPECIES: hypothetical protein [Dethiosulfovibrio]|uniref:Uncharacterized protein n=2 Tax=Dethiosulfovibrio TaxID=47054 RepID=A0ABS9ER45_9BACT|nr:MULTISPECIES: hypothetical protein [Dethiosulfovibrio]MCF4115204.1 hypothetical protein [Dethiosulfovibrio russensis]MCF4143667.1 hypothetical protein [Dethiosulfovibrio marinus]MCF4146099.1 hypothetical protein [Dethiosulfovibrio acidaminovorans]MEA3283623.1 hypothetical protein [Synergistota bacterium]
MRKKERLWLMWMAVVTVLDVALPFGVLRESGSFRGAFSVWLVLTLAVVLSGAIYTGSWGTERRP